MHRSRLRLLCQVAFFVLFVMAPVFDVLRYDLGAQHLILFGEPWRLGIDDFIAGRITAGEMTANLLLRLFLPILVLAGVFLAVAWRWGRLYCGWLCPHFSVVETINRVMVRAIGKHSLWDSKRVPPLNPDGSPLPRDPHQGWLVLPLAVGFALVWAVVFLTYLLPPAEVYGNLFSAALTRNQMLFIGAATVVLTLEFTLARHLFCRYACAVGMFQSLAWMANRNAMVVGFERPRASLCGDCHAACDHACPMRLKPRNVKRLMFACTQCGQCMDACDTVQRNHPERGLLHWVSDEAARQNEAGFRAGKAIPVRKVRPDNSSRP